MKLKAVDRTWKDAKTGETKAYKAIVVETSIGEISVRFKTLIEKNAVLAELEKEVKQGK